MARVGAVLRLAALTLHMHKKFSASNVLRGSMSQRQKPGPGGSVLLLALIWVRSSTFSFLLVPQFPRLFGGSKVWFSFREQP